MRFTVRRMGNSWWIVGDEEDGPYGPYDTKTEAEDDRKGLNRTERHWDDREYWTTKKETTL